MARIRRSITGVFIRNWCLSRATRQRFRNCSASCSRCVWRSATSTNCPRPKRGKVEDEATRDAIAAFRQRAAVVAEVLGKPYKIRHLNVQQNGQMPPMPMLRASRAMAADAAPAGAAGSRRKPGDDNGQRPDRTARLSHYTPSNSCTCDSCRRPARRRSLPAGRPGAGGPSDIERGAPGTLTCRWL